jgi:hypothetical protein
MVLLIEKLPSGRDIHRKQQIAGKMRKNRKITKRKDEQKKAGKRQKY